MTGPKTIPETIRNKAAMARRDLIRIADLREQAVARGLDADRLDAMYESLADHIAVLEAVGGMLAAKPDPRDTPAWRESDEGRGLERMRAQERAAKNF